MTFQLSRAAKYELTLLLYAVVPEAIALTSATAELAFSTTRQSLWGPSGPAVIDTGKLFVGPQWGALKEETNVAFQYGLTIKIPRPFPNPCGGFLQLPCFPLQGRSVTIGSTSRTDIDLTGNVAPGRIGFDFQAILDPGSVDVLYSSGAELDVVDDGITSGGMRRLFVHSSESTRDAQGEERRSDGSRRH